MDDPAEASSFKTDYAASGRSKCNRCRQPIAQGAFRIGPMVQSDKGDFKYPQWHHFSCFEDGWMKKNPGALKSVASISGIDTLKFEDQKKLKSLVVGGDSTLETKAVTAEEKQVAADNKLLWSRKEKLETMQNNEIQALLEHNKQPNSGKIFGGRNKMIERAADGMVFGALKKCTVCGNGDFYFSHGKYKCTGSIDEFAKCENSTTDPGREPFKVPTWLQDDYDFLAKYKFKARERNAIALEAENPNAVANAAVANAAAEGDDGATKDDIGQKRKRAADPEDAVKALQPFQGYTVIFAGKLSRTQKELQSLITSNGGTTATTVNQASICVCTSQEATGNGSQKGKDALKKGVLCVDEKWIDKSIEAGHRLADDDITALVLANPKVKVADEKREERKKLGDKLALEAEAQRQRELLEEKHTDQPAGGLKSTGNTKKLVVKGDTAVEPSSGLQEDGTIYVAKDTKYTAIMNHTDVTTGKNSFYILQIIQHKDKAKDVWTLYRKWGKLGDDSIGGDKHMKYPMVEPAIREFRKVFLDKTGNEFGTKNFKKVYGKFMPIEVDYSAKNPGGDGGDDAPDLNDGAYNGKLDKATQSLISLIFDIKAMSASLKEMEIDTTKLPLGNLSKKTIQEGFSALSELQKLVDGVEDLEPVKAKITSLTNRFYNFIPHVAPTDTGRLPMLNTVDLIKSKTELLNSLQDLEIASKLVVTSSTADASKKEHPIDTHYQRLKTDLCSVDKKSDEFKRIRDYLQNTHAATHSMYTLELVDLWTVERDGEKERFEPWKNDHNRQLLWHGSRITNWSGILSQGLRIAPPEAPTTGYMFGKGVYFADMSSKSANYCFTSSEKTTGVLMLGEVALGDMQELKRAHFVDPPKEWVGKSYKSCKGVGKNHPNPKGSFMEDHGCKIPMGKGQDSGVKDTSLLYNEFIVYSVDQIKMRYLLRVEFHYKKKCGTFF